MQYSIHTEKNWQTTVSVVVTDKDIQAQYDNALKNVRKDVQIEGFRKGKVPEPLIKKLYASKIESEANQLCIERAWDAVFEENEFYLLSDPQLTNLNPTDSGGMTFEIKFESRPELKVEGYEGMEVQKVIYEVTNDDVDQALEEARNENAMMYTVDDKAEEGHYLYADFQEVDSTGVPVIGQKLENQQIWLNKNDDELTPQLLGVRVGDERRVALTIRPQKSEFIEQPGLEKIEKFYLAHIREVKERRLPELNDDFAKELGDFETLAQVRDQIEKNLRHQAEHATEDAFETALGDALIEKMDFDIPETMLNHYLDNIIDDVKARNRNNREPIDEDRYRQIYRAIAIRELKWHLICEKLRAQENFTATEQDIEDKLAHYGEHGQDGMKRAEAIRKNEKELERLTESIIFDKLYAFLADKAKVTQVRKPWRELQETVPDQTDSALEESDIEAADD
ncbi:trigger factor [candidate division KSB1 bacterium]|nr:trigger factor [candidate division KSB1 bacterium]